jgi:hypothetical protein
MPNFAILNRTAKRIFQWKIKDSSLAWMLSLFIRSIYRDLSLRIKDVRFRRSKSIHLEGINRSPQLYAKVQCLKIDVALNHDCHDFRVFTMYKCKEIIQGFNANSYVMVRIQTIAMKYRWFNKHYSIFKILSST